SATHSGDGFFLWAGQSTMDSGRGGCNDNILFGNDFSYAPANGVEVTFSTNKILKNRIFECDNGLWGGYSYHTEIANNQFRNNKTAIAIEHGQYNDIHHNLFFRDQTAIKLWAAKDQPADWGYVRFRDTRSRNYNLLLNSYNENKIAIDIIRTDSIKIFGDRVSGTGEFLKIDSTVSHLDTSQDDELVDKFSVDSAIMGPIMDNPSDPFKGMSKLAGRKNILVTEWGPYDFRSPVMWNANPIDTGDIMLFDIKGPSGKWKILSYKGLDSISAETGTIPATITGRKLKGEGIDIDIRLEYIGDEITTQYGETISKGKPYIFSFQRFFQPIDWVVNWFALDSSNVAHGDPVKTEKVNQLSYAWWGGIKAGAQYTRFETVAEGIGNFQQGIYEFGITWDDGARLYVDGKLIIDEWDPAKYNFDESTPHRRVKINLAGGKHQLRVEHIELGGFAALALSIKKSR
ncbi:MAG TPA: PA14 domain-containing protein, partial [Chitinophagaceae bacterium]